MGMPGFAGVNGIPVSMDIIYIISYIDCSVQDFSNFSYCSLALSHRYVVCDLWQWHEPYCQVTSISDTMILHNDMVYSWKTAQFFYIS